jgi:hypothetical protein
MFPLSIIFLFTIFVNAKQITNRNNKYTDMFHFASNLLLSLAGSFVRSILSKKKKYLERDHVKLESPFSVRIWKVRKDNLVLGIFRMAHKPLNGSNNDVAQN